MVLRLKDISFSFKLTDWRSLSTPLYLCLPAHIHMDAQQLIGGGMNGFDESGIYWECGLGLAAVPWEHSRQ